MSPLLPMLAIHFSNCLLYSMQASIHASCAHLSSCSPCCTPVRHEWGISKGLACLAYKILSVASTFMAHACSASVYSPRQPYHCLVLCWNISQMASLCTCMGVSAALMPRALLVLHVDRLGCCTPRVLYLSSSQDCCACAGSG